MNDSLGAILMKLLDMAQTNSWFWVVLVVIAAPFILWWWNMLRRQWAESGLKLSSVKEVLTRLKPRETISTPSPKSGSPFSLWRELLPWPFTSFPLILLLLALIKQPFSGQWWITAGSLVFAFSFVFGLPIYIAAIANYFRIKRMVNGARKFLAGTSIGADGAKVTYLNVFIALAVDLRMGLDPRVIPLICRYGRKKVDSSILAEFVRLRLVKPDNRVREGTLAHRYYLTRIGATLIKENR